MSPDPTIAASVPPAREAPAPSVLNIARKRNYVRVCCEHMLENLGDSTSLQELCRVAGASPRTIEYAFRAVLDTSPMAWFRDQRFNAAHSVLRSTERRARSVTDVATRFSFWHLGRFSVEYRLRFGEPPSATLRRARASA